MTECKRVELAMKEVEEVSLQKTALLTSILESPQGIIIFSLDGSYRYTEFTRSHAETMRNIWGVEIAIGQNILDVITSLPDREKAKLNFDRVLAGESLLMVEEYGDLSRVRTYYENHYNPIRDAADAISGVSVFVIDITERKKAETALRESETNFHAFFESMTDMLMVGALDGQVLFTNAAVTQTLGYSPDELREMHLLDLNSRTSALEADEIFAAMLRGERDICPMPLACKDGRLIPVETRVWFGRWNGVDCIFGISKNLTGEQEAQQRFERLFRNNPALMALSSLPDQRFADVNNAFLKTLGYSWADIIGKTVADIGIFLQPEKQVMLSEKLRTDGRISEFELQVRRKDGAILDGLFSGEIIRSQGREFFLTVMNDITERKRAEADKEKMHGQLVQAQKMESVGQLAGGVAHDFNNLLMGIMGYAELCRESLPAEHPGRLHLDEITHASTRSADLTRQLLAFARKQVIAPRVLDLNAAVEGMLSLLRQMIGEDLHLAWLPGTKLWSVKLDPSQIDQILANLCGNARDAIVGVGKITLETANITLDQTYCAGHTGSVPGEYVRLTVSDDGCGMEKDVLAKIFEPFFTTKAVGEGTGLGLATVYGIVKQNFGYIDVTSEPGRGACFCIYLPRVVCETAPSTGAITAGPPQGRGETVMLVEDERSLRKICRLYLDSLGYKTLAAETPAAALEMAARHPGDIHLMLTDVVMPGMNGRDLVKNMVPLYPHLKYLFMSGYTADVIARQGVLDEGMQFLPKPFSRDVLARKVREVLEAP
ncbi:MAG: PAS domain S-box protein [bacterium]